MVSSSSSTGKVASASPWAWKTVWIHAASLTGEQPTVCGWVLRWTA
ncbi:hypothetical protein [Umezawaea sp.]